MAKANKDSYTETNADAVAYFISTRAHFKTKQQVTLTDFPSFFSPIQRVSDSWLHKSTCPINALQFPNSARDLK